MKAEDLKGMSGRKVIVEAIITDVNPQDGVAAIVTISGGPMLAVPHAAIREIIPAEIKVGDRVRHQMFPDVDAVTVLALHDGRAWVLHTNGALADLDQSRLILVEPAQ